MFSIARFCLFVILIIRSSSSSSLPYETKDENQNTKVLSEGEKLAKCNDDNVNLKIERLERTTQIFERLIFKYLSDNSSEIIGHENTKTNLELMKQIQMNMSNDLSDLKNSIKHMNVLNEVFKRDILTTLDETFYNHSAKITENMAALYDAQRSELQDIIHKSFVLRESIKRDYDTNLNCLTKCNFTDNLPKSCAEVTAKEDDIYKIYVPNSDLKPFYAFCTHEKAGEKAWTVIQRREDGSQNFNRNWTDYKHGFGDAYGEYWIGLERMHKMTKRQPHELWIALVDYDGEKRYAKYSKFSIDSEDEGYKLYVEGYSGNAGDSLGRHNNQKFATYDKDNEGCATFFESGWWFSDCYFCNLNGVFRSYSNRKMYKAFHWNDWQKASLKYSHMAIRPL